ncbi:head-tail connector protein [Shinella curvata]|uniref:Head-tail connector protein n=1 Tax=Shinella curvata TaxID=1817964 RepID=A0ABT8XHK7_9HYPH|nr:head-tail connector protein [Shinella curvata]MCJ8053889.1 head-tail connector protein [Shinella curvata]MDO6123221.1 head-tail connector protein [Shinella curvata]
MAIVTLAQLKEQLNFDEDLGTADDVLLGRKIEAAQNHIERLLGFKIGETYGGTEQEAIPPSLVEAVLQLAAHWYENREATLVGVTAEELPFGVWEIVREYRDWSFGG